MFNYIPFHINDLDKIQNEILGFASSILNINKTIYKQVDDLETLLSLPLLRKEFEKTGVIDHIRTAYIVITGKKFASPIHQDLWEGHSLLIPVLGCEETYRNYFTAKENTVGNLTDNINYSGDSTTIGSIRYDINDVIRDVCLETTVPTIHNPKYIHNFVNTKDTPRIMSIFMLDSDWHPNSGSILKTK